MPVTTKKRASKKAAVAELLKSSATIYGIHAADSTECFYIGSTVNDEKLRFQRHLWEVRTGKHRNCRFTAKVKEIGSENCRIKVLEIVDEEQRFEREYHWIQQTQARGVKLTNVVSSLSQAEYFIEHRRTVFLRYVETLSIMYKNALLRLDEPPIADMAIWMRRDLLDVFGPSAGVYIKEFGEAQYQAALKCATEREVLPLLGVSTALTIQSSNA